MFDRPLNTLCYWLGKNVKLYSFYLIHLFNYASRHFDVPELIAPLLISESRLVALLTSDSSQSFDHTPLCKYVSPPL